MMRRRLAAVLGLTLGALGACSSDGSSGPEGFREDASSLIGQSSLFQPGFGEVQFVARDGNILRAFTYRGNGFESGQGPIWFVMHGAARDADRYLAAAAPIAERHGALAVAIEFPKSHYPGSSDYTLGVTEKNALGQTVWRDPADYVYANVELLFDLLRQAFGGSQPGYHLYGHSAGSQFTHRMLTFLPAPRVLSAVAANAGWYTLPAASDPVDHAMPYGLLETPLEPADLTDFLRTRFMVLLGEDDTRTAAEDDLVRGTPEAQAQGIHRFDRGRNYFQVGESLAADLGSEFGWRLETIPNVGHDGSRMMQSAGFLIFEPDAELCAPSRVDIAIGISFTEIMADPPSGLAGDLNRDGVRDPQEDEFVEIHNSGPEPVCMSGWTLGDAVREDRHVFPLGTVLEPGETLVVFGGGIPTGEFAGAKVQWSSSGLSLSNQGDVVTLRDARGSIAVAFSWGDEGGSGPAKDHWPTDLGAETSLEGGPEPGSEWQLRRGDGSSSPGVVNGGRTVQKAGGSQ
jgi:hypothetical protein